MAIVVADSDPVSRATATNILNQAQRVRPRLGEYGRDVTIMIADQCGFDPVSRPAGSGLVILTERPSTLEAAAALLLGADAYLPVVLAPVAIAVALERVAQGQMHIEPETAAVLRSMVTLTGGAVPHDRVAGIRMALGLVARGWRWRDAAASAEVEAAAVSGWIQRLLRRIRSQHLILLGNEGC